MGGTRVNWDELLPFSPMPKYIFAFTFLLDYKEGARPIYAIAGAGSKLPFDLLFGNWIGASSSVFTFALGDVGDAFAFSVFLLFSSSLNDFGTTSITAPYYGICFFLLSESYFFSPTELGAGVFLAGVGLVDSVCFAFISP